MDTITTIQSLLTCNGSAQPAMVALTPNELRLIAAAPDMLAALQLIAAFHGKTLIAPRLGPDGDKGHQVGANTAFNQAAEIAIDAIAKATAPSLFPSA